MTSGVICEKNKKVTIQMFRMNFICFCFSSYYIKRQQQKCIVVNYIPRLVSNVNSYLFASGYNFF